MDVTIPVAGSGWGPVTNITWLNVHFRLWPEQLGVAGAYLQGTGRSPTGVLYAFAITPGATAFGGNLSFPGPSEWSWYSPDGSFGLTWTSYRAGGWGVRLWAADPSPVFAVQQVTLPPPTFRASHTTSVAFANVSFDLRIDGWGVPGGPSLNVSAIDPEGRVLPFSIWDGPLVACGRVGNSPPYLLANATCLANGDADHNLVVLWDGYRSVTLMVRGE